MNYQVLLLCLVLAVPLAYEWRWRLRARAMRTLARQYGLEFTTGRTSLWEWYAALLFWRYAREGHRVNCVSGVLHGHSVLIYDLMWPGGTWLNYEKANTVNEIDGVNLRGGFKTFELGDEHLVTVRTLEKLLDSLR